MLATEAIPTDWIHHLQGGRIGIGYDVATTEKKTSNPSSITVTEEWDGILWQRLIVRYKSSDPDAAMEMLFSILAAAPRNLLDALCVDSSNEKFHAKTVQKKFRRFCPIHMIGGGETLLWQGEKYTFKTLLGQLYVSDFEDNRVALPDGEWIVKDHRLVKNHAGSFAADTDDEGNHADTFDSGKLSHWALKRGRRYSGHGVEAIRVGGEGGKAQRSTGDPFLDLARNQARARLTS